MQGTQNAGGNCQQSLVILNKNSFCEPGLSKLAWTLQIQIWKTEKIRKDWFQIWSHNIEMDPLPTRQSMCVNAVSLLSLYAPNPVIYWRAPAPRFQVPRVEAHPTRIDSQLLNWICRVFPFWILAKFPDLYLEHPCKFSQAGKTQINSLRK